MRTHEDRFKTGDLVTWRSEFFAKITSGRSRFGDRLTIKEVSDVSSRSIRSAGHTQYVAILEESSPRHWWSGAFFRHLAPFEKETKQ